MPGRDGRDGGGDDDDASSHGSMPALEPLVAGGIGSSSRRAVGSSPAAASSGVRSNNEITSTRNGGEEDTDDDDSSMPSLEDIPPGRAGGVGGGGIGSRASGTARPRRDLEDNEVDEVEIIDLIARAMTDALINKKGVGETDSSDDDDEDDSSMPPLEDIARDTKSSAFQGGEGQGSKRSGWDRPRDRDGKIGKNKPISPPSSNPFNFATGPLASSGPSTKNENVAPSPFNFSTGPLASSKASGNAPGKTKSDSKKSTFVFSPTSVATPSSMSTSPSTGTGKKPAFQFTSAGGGNDNTSAPGSSLLFSTASKDPSLQIATKFATSSASKLGANGKDSGSLFAPAPSSTPDGGGGGASDRRRKKKRDATGNRACSPLLSPQLDAKPSPSPFQFGPSAGAVQPTSPDLEASGRVIERAVEDILSTGRSTNSAVISAMAEEDVAKGDGLELSPKPKENSSAFFIFSDEKKKEVVSQNPRASSAEIQQTLLSKFYSLSPGERSRYEELATRDKERYQREMTTWEMTRERIRDTPSSTTLFVANFDPKKTADDDLRKVFHPHEISHMYVRRNIALVDFSSIGAALAAREAVNGSVLDGNVISVSHAVGQRPEQYKNGDAFYKDERRAAFKEQNPGFSGLQVDGALQAQYFCSLTDEERAKYNKLAFDDDRRFNREMEEWESENRKVSDVVEPPSSSGNCESYHAVTLPAGDAFTFGNNSLYQSDGAPRRILRARRPPDVSSTQGSSDTNAAHSSSDTPANSTAPSTDADAPSGTGMTTTGTRSINTPTSSTNAAAGGLGARGDVGDAEREEEEANIDPNANAFGALAEDSDDEDDQDAMSSDNSSASDDISLSSSDDDDDDDDDSEDFPLQFLQDMLPGGMRARVAARLMNGGGPGRRRELSTNIQPDGDDGSIASSDDDDDDAAAKCCACYRRGDQNHKWRRLVTLPCCGLGGKEKSSSTRFCASCILKLAVTRSDSASSVNEYHYFEDERSEPPVSHFYKESRQSDSKRFIECPRCRDILIVKLKNLKKSYTANDNDESSSGECDCSECRAERRANREPVEIKMASSISMHRAAFKEKAWFVGRKRDNAMILWRAAHLHRSFIPIAALGGDKSRANVVKLAGWGILQKVPGKRNVDIYRMNMEDQIELVKLVSPDPKTETDEQLTKEFDLFLELTHDMGLAGWECVKKLRIDRAIRLLNRFLYLLLYFRRYLPSPPMSLWQEWVVTALNGFNLALVLQFLLIMAVYAGLLFGVGVTVCRALRNPEKFRSASRWAHVSAILGAYLTYRLGKVLYHSPYITFLGFLSPKAIIPFKKILRG